MAILENIRKRTTVLILIIGLALFAFVISGIFTNDGFSGGKVGTTVAEINDEDVSIDEFRSRVERSSSRMPAQMTSMQLVNSVWNQMLRNEILGQQVEELGIAIEKDQIFELLKSNPAFTQNPQFQDENGNFDERRFREFLAELKANAPEQYRQWLADEDAIVQAAKEQVYLNLVKAGMTATLKEGELDYKLANNKVDIRYARVPYTSIPDSAVTVSKKEIQAYIKENKASFKQEPARDIQFVYFQEKPSTEDEAAIETAITDLLKDREEYLEESDTTVTVAGFQNTDDLDAFLDRNSDMKYDTIYKSRNQLPSKFADSITSLKVGELFGPYRDGGALKVTKMVNKKEEGSVKASHILIAYEGAMRANPAVTRTQEEAEERAKELLAEARKEGTVFATLARDNSDGPSASRGGDLGYFQEGVMTPKFNDFAFDNPVGTIGMVETEFGYHIVKVDDKQDIYRVATLAREIEPSEETINTLFTEATSFEMDATAGEKSFPELAKEQGYVVRPVNKLKAMDENLPGLGAQRSIVQWAFNEDTDIGDIRRFDLNDGYAVVQLTAAYKEGLMSAEDASATVLPILRKQKKAERIMEANNGKSMQEIASSNNVSITTASSLTVKSPTIPGAGREPLVVGTAFSMEEGGTSDLIEGNSGVFMLEVTRKEEAPELDNYSTYANTLWKSNMARVNATVFEALKEKAEIEDNRANFY